MTGYSTRSFTERVVIMGKRGGALLLTVLLLLTCLPLTAFAQDGAPTQSYTHWDMANGSKKVVSMRPVYEADEVLDIRSIGLSEGIEKIADIDTDDEGNIYVLTSDGRLFSVGADHRLKKEYTVSDETGEKLDITGAQGILIESPDEIYIADTLNQRVLCCDGEGAVTRQILRPDSELLEEDFIFAPMKVEIDSKDMLYVLCDGGYYGALMFDRDGVFSGFYGANTVRGSALTTLAYIWDKLTKNDIKRANSVKKLPYQFIDLYIDAGDFVYTCTGRTSSGASTGQIRRLSPSGTNILYKQRWNGTRVDASGFNFGENTAVRRQNKPVVQNFVGVQVDERGYMYALDNTFGIVYIYDTDCNLICAFGGGRDEGNQAGTFADPVALVYDSSRVMVADAALNTITIFRRTDYGELLMTAEKKTLDADYTGAAAEWKQVLALDSNSRLALRGLAKAAYREGDYDTALRYAKDGFDFVTYGQALEETHSAFTEKNFLWIFLIVVLVVGALAAFMVITIKRKIVLIKNEKVRLLFTAPLHPFDTFNAIKYKQKGSVLIAVVMTLLYYISGMLSETCSNFRFTTFDPLTSSSVFLFIRTVGLVVLFTVANWAVCVLAEGKGKLKEIFIVTAYATLPLVVYNVLATILSHLITEPNSALLAGLSTVALIIAGIILAVGLMVIHEYSFPKLLFSVALALFAMLLIVFILFMIGMLVSQLWTFLVTVFMEAVYR